MATLLKNPMIFCLLSIGLFSVLSVAELPCFHHPVKPDGSLSFLVVGDWGRGGFYNQSEVAHQMGRVGKKLDIDFVISTGDNFYEDGLMAVNDSAFYESFTNIYTGNSLQKKWYTVLGNHDYRGDVEAQLSPILRQKDKRWLCFRSFILNADQYFTDPENHTYDWTGVSPRKNYISNLIKDVDLALRKSTAKWKMVVGHHTIMSAGHHGVTQELLVHLLPIFEANKVDIYMNGHDHCLEHIDSIKSKIKYLTSGGGSKAWRGDIKGWNPEEMKFYYDGQGFMSVLLNEAQANFTFYDVFGKVLHTTFISKHLFSAS